MPWAQAVRRPGSLRPLRRRPTGSRGRRGCACAGGNRAPCDGGGCSAGRYACSRAISPKVSEGCPLHSGIGARPAGSGRRSAGTAHPRGRHGGGVVDMRHPSTRSDRPTVRGGEEGVKPTSPPARGQPVDDVLPPMRRPVVTFTASAVPCHHGPSRVTLTCDPGHMATQTAADLRKRWKDRRHGAPSGPVPSSGRAVHRLWTTLWTTVRRSVRVSSARDQRWKRRRSGGRPAGRSRDGWQQIVAGPPAQPAGVAARRACR